MRYLRIFERAQTLTTLAVLFYGAYIALNPDVNAACNAHAERRTDGPVQW